MSGETVRLVTISATFDLVESGEHRFDGADIAALIDGLEVGISAELGGSSGTGWNIDHVKTSMIVGAPERALDRHTEVGG